MDFEFDSMGDYLKAERLLGRKCDDGDRFRTLVRLYDQMDTAHRARFNRYKKYNFIKAFLSMWNPSAVYWEKQEFMKGKLTSLLLSTMSMRNLRDDRNTLTLGIIGDILRQNPDYIDTELILNNMKLYGQGLMDGVHNQLTAMKMIERDLKWTTKVNGLFDGGCVQGFDRRS